MAGGRHVVGRGALGGGLGRAPPPHRAAVLPGAGDGVVHGARRQLQRLLLHQGGARPGVGHRLSRGNSYYIVSNTHGKATLFQAEYNR